MWFGGGKSKQEAAPGALGAVPIFDGLSEAQLAAVLERCEETTFEAGSTIFKIGSVGDAAYFILSGTARTRHADSSRKTQEGGPGVLLGELAMLVDVTYSGSIIAKDRVRALAIRRTALREVMDADPSIAHHFSRKLMDRLADLSEELRTIDSQFAAVEEALAKTG